MALITYQDVEAALGVTLTTDEQTAVEDTLIPWATAEVVSLLNRSVETTEVVAERYPYSRVYPLAGGCLHLARTPVLEVAEVRMVTATASDVVDVDSYRLLPWGIAFDLLPISVVWGDQLWIEVDYTAAMVNLGAEMVGMVEQVMSNAVGRAITVRRGNAFADAEGALGVSSLSVEGYSVAFGTGGGGNPEGRVAIVTATIGMFEPSEVQALQRLRRRVVR